MANRAGCVRVLVAGMLVGPGVFASVALAQNAQGNASQPSGGNAPDVPLQRGSLGIGTSGGQAPIVTTPRPTPPMPTTPTMPSEPMTGGNWNGWPGAIPVMPKPTPPGVTQGVGDGRLRYGADGVLHLPGGQEIYLPNGLRRANRWGAGWYTGGTLSLWNSCSLNVMDPSFAGYPGGWWVNDYRRATPVYDPTGYAPAAFLERPVPPAPQIQEAPEMTALERGELRLRTGDAVGADSALREHLKANPTDAKGLRTLGLALLEQRKVSEAIAVVMAAYTLDPTLAQAPIAPGTIPGDASDLRARFTQVVEIANRQKSASPAFVAAVLAQAEGRKEVALRMLNRATEQGLSAKLGDAMRHALGK